MIMYIALGVRYVLKHINNILQYNYLQCNSPQISRNTFFQDFKMLWKSWWWHITHLIFSVFEFYGTLDIFFSSHRRALGTALSQRAGGGGSGWGGCGGKNHIFWNDSDPVHPIYTKFGMDILLDIRNKPADEFFIFIKIQDGRRRSKVQNWPNLTLEITFRPGIRILLIQYGQNVA